MPRVRKLALATLAAGLYTAVALFYLWPIATVFRDHLAPEPVDPVFNLYVLKWGVHQIRLGLPHLWDANFFYPTRGVLTFSDHLLGPAFELALLHPLVPNAIAGYNLLFFTSFVLSGLATCFVLRKSGCSWPAAILGGAMFAFSPYRLSQLNHIQILLAQWIPLTLWSWDRLLAERTAKWGGLFLLFYLLNLSGGCYFAYMIHVPLLAILVVRAASERRRLVSPAARKVLLPVALVAFAAAACLFYPYARVAREQKLVRDPSEVVKNAAAFASYWSPARLNSYAPSAGDRQWVRENEPWKMPFLRSENSLFAGFLPTLLFAVGCGDFWRRHRQRPALPLGGGRRLTLGALLVLALLAYGAGDAITLKLVAAEEPPGPAVWAGLGALFAGALGAWLFLRRRWGGNSFLRAAEMNPWDPWERGLALSAALCFLLSHPLVYVPLMRIVPGLAGMRVPARFAAFLSLSVVFFAARGLDRLLPRMARRSTRALAWSALAIALFVELAPLPIRWVAIFPESEFPEVYQWLAGRSDVRALAEIPFHSNSKETAYMYYSTLHWKPIANGFSGYIPPSHDELASRLRPLPDADDLDFMAGLGITHLVVHTWDLSGKWNPNKGRVMVAEWERELGPRLSLACDSDPDRVYRIVPAA
ncbi:MAG TPA: hypothetical protein VOA87_17430, partial [Thermoanaerobaculia bacterium]|nr:hypothetical protein [Thermoanaerobaculia bacterium]